MKIVVLAGGWSEERDVSLSSGSQIANALLMKEHEVLLIDLLAGIENEQTFADAHKVHRQAHYSHQITETVPDISHLTSTKKELIGPNVLSICQGADCVFLALHGGIGENGQLQALFDLYGIHYTGSDYKSSLLAMDKIVTKELVSFNGFNTPNWVVVTKETDLHTVSLPAVVKPNDNGSSIGIEIVETFEALQESVSNAFSHSSSSTVLIEQKVAGREFSVGILGEIPLPVIELIPKNGFYDYQNKYQAGLTTEVVPAVLSEDLQHALQRTALEVHHLLGLSTYSRIDFIVDDAETIFLIEANSLPGMTPTSLLPQEAAAAGISYVDLCDFIVKKSAE